MMKRICLWSSPRNISTAMMYSFAQRPDTIVFDEPLYAYYLSVSGVQHPGREEILQSQSQDGNEVIKKIILGEFEKPIVFFKQMTHHLVNIKYDFLNEVSNVLFIRDPKQIISSYAQVRAEVNVQDLGIEKQWWLFNFLNEKNIPAIVLDSDELLKNAEVVLKKLCIALRIPFYNEMLHWQKGEKKEDGIWAKYWYTNVHQSTGFEKQQTSERTLPEYLRPLYLESKKYYDQLLPYSITI
jgi:hypothetical protein